MWRVENRLCFVFDKNIVLSRREDAAFHFFFLSSSFQYDERDVTSFFKVYGDITKCSVVQAVEDEPR